MFDQKNKLIIETQKSNATIAAAALPLRTTKEWGPLCAERTALVGHLSRGGLRKPLGRGGVFPFFRLFDVILVTFPSLNRKQSKYTKSPVLRNSFCILISYFCLLGSLSAQEERFELLKTYTKVPESPPAKSFTLLTDERQITFIPPQGSIVQLHREKREIWMSFADDRCLIKLQLSTNSPGMVSPDYCEQLRKLVQDRYPDAEVGPANFCYNSCSAGRSFDIQRPTASKMKLITRLAFVPFHDGMLEVSVSAADAKFHNAQFALTWLLNSLRVEKPNPDTLAPRKD
jgi:hypothetical protein